MNDELVQTDIKTLVQEEGKIGGEEVNRLTSLQCI